MMQATHAERQQALNVGARLLFNLYPLHTKVNFPMLIGGLSLKACAVLKFPGVVHVFCLDSGKTIVRSARGYPLDLPDDGCRTIAGPLAAAPGWPVAPDSLSSFWAWTADVSARRAALLAGAELLTDTYPRQSKVNLTICPGLDAVSAYAVLLWPGVVRVSLSRGGGVIAQSKRGEPYTMASLPRHLLRLAR